MTRIYFLFLTMLAFTSNATAENESLAQQLEAYKAKSTAAASESKKAAYEEGVRAVVRAGIVASAKQVGDQAPDFTLTNASGEEVTLSTMLKDGPVVLTWYRGGWCPYCNLTLRALQQKLPEFQAAGAQLLALTPELPDNSLSTSEKNGLEFQVLTDLNHKIAKEYGTLFNLTPEVARLYKEAFNLQQYNGDDAKDNELPLAATYIIDKDGTIQWAFLDADYRNRAEPTDIVAALKAL
tara:strand:- start:6791 stop:7504 length:714 start_codon:yes stop_codon:yes gene_type:complete